MERFESQPVRLKKDGIKLEQFRGAPPGLFHRNRFVEFFPPDLAKFAEFVVVKLHDLQRRCAPMAYLGW
jgi:hypothetical protein